MLRKCVGGEGSCKQSQVCLLKTLFTLLHQVMAGGQVSLCPVQQSTEGELSFWRRGMNTTIRVDFMPDLILTGEDHPEWRQDMEGGGRGHL